MKLKLLFTLFILFILIGCENKKSSDLKISSRKQHQNTNPVFSKIVVPQKDKTITKEKKTVKIEQTTDYIPQALTNLAVFEKALNFEIKCIPKDLTEMTLEEARKSLENISSYDDIMTVTEQLKEGCKNFEAGDFLFSNLYVRMVNLSKSPGQIGMAWATFAMSHRKSEYAVSLFDKTIAVTEKKSEISSLKFFKALAYQLDGNFEKSENAAWDAYIYSWQNRNKPGMESAATDNLILCLESLHNVGKNDEAVTLIETLKNDDKTILEKLPSDLIDDIYKDGNKKKYRTFTDLRH